jgi:hypothetical protein
MGQCPESEETWVGACGAVQTDLGLDLRRYHPRLTSPGQSLHKQPMTLPPRTARVN